MASGSREASRRLGFQVKPSEIIVIVIVVSVTRTGQLRRRSRLGLAASLGSRTLRPAAGLEFPPRPAQGLCQSSPSPEAIRLGVMPGPAT